MPVKPNKIYKAYLEQSGTDNPTVTIFENTIGDIIWSRSSEGFFLGSLDNAFPPAKTFLLHSNRPFTVGNGSLIDFDAFSPHFVVIKVLDTSGGLVGATIDGFKAFVLIEIIP